jgi:hypothetical protein
VNGAIASGVAGAIYKSLSEQRYFTADGGDRRPVAFPILAGGAK